MSKRPSSTIQPSHTDTLAPNATRSQPRIVPKKSKLALALQSKLSTKPSASKLAKENDAKDVAGEVGVTASDIERKQSKLKPRLRGSASKLGGFSSMVRQASRNLLKDVTNTESSNIQDKEECFVNVGVVDVPENIVYSTIGVERPRSPLTEAEMNAVEGNDPDIAEIMVVKRPKARAPLDLEWAQSGQETTGTQEPDTVNVTDGESHTGRTASGWWLKSKGKKSEITEGEVPHSQHPSMVPIISITAEEDKSTVRKKGSLVLRAVRSVRSLAQVPTIGTLRTGEQRNLESASDVASKSKLVPATHLRKKAPAFTLRRPSVDPNSSWEAGRLSSSPEPERRSSLFVPNSGVIRSASEAQPVISRPLQLRRPSHPVNQTQKTDSEVPKPNAAIQFDPIVPSQANNRLSVISILTTDSATDSSSQPNAKENRRASTGSTIRWDPEAVSQQAKRERLEERRKLRAQRREAERVNGTPVQERKEKSSSSARSRTPLSSVFDISISSAASPEADDTIFLPAQSSLAPPPPVDPIFAATQALLQMPSKRQEVDASAVARPRPRSKDLAARPRPVGMIADDNTTTDGIRAANADLRSLIGTMDSPATPGIRFAVASPVSALNDGSMAEEQPKEDSPSRLRLSRRMSGPMVAQQVAAWPPVTATRPSATSTDTLLVPQRERNRTSSSSSNPPSAFNFRNSLVEKESSPEVPSLTLRTLRSEQGNVQKKAKFYGELERDAKKDVTSVARKASVSDSSFRSRRSIQGNAVHVTADEQGVAQSLVDIVTDIPQDLTVVLSQSPTVVDLPLLPPKDVPVTHPSPSTTESTQEFVYTGVDAQTNTNAASPNTFNSSEYSMCKEFSSYDKISHADITIQQPANPVSPTPTSSDIFAHRTKPQLSHHSEQSVASMESAESYCVVSKRPPVRKVQPLVLHGKQPSVDTSDISAEDTFADKLPDVFGHSAHRRARSILSIASGDSEGSFSPLRRPALSDKFFASSNLLSDITDSPLTATVSTPASILPSSPGSVGGYTSTDSLFDTPHHRMSSSSTIASVFAPDASDNVSRGNLFSGTRPKSLISNYSNVGMVNSLENKTPVRCLDGEMVKNKTYEPLSPTEQAQKSRLMVKPIRIPSPKKGGNSSPIEGTFGKQPSLRVRPRGIGHRRAKALYARPLVLTEPICEAQEDVPDLYHSPPRSRGSSNTSTETTGSAEPTAVAEAGPDTSMVLRRYYTLQREAQDEIDHSQLLYEDTAFSFDELSSFEVPTKPDDMAVFLESSRKFYFELPSEMRARRRALAAPYTVPLSSTEDIPESPVVDVVFKDLSTWDHRRTRKASDEKIRSRKVSEEKMRVRTVSIEGRVRKVSEGRTRKVSESRKRKKSNPMDVPPLPTRTFAPFVDSKESQLPARTTQASSKASEEGAKLEPVQLNSLRRSRANIKLDIKLESKPSLSPKKPSKENTLRTKHSVEGLLESPTGSLRIARPRPKKRGSIAAVSPPSSLRL